MTVALAKIDGMDNVINMRDVIRLVPEESEQPKAKNNNKKKGIKSEVYPFEPNDLKNMLKYFSDNEKWIHYLLLVVGCNTARRIGDILSLEWRHFYNPANGNFRSDLLAIEEEKTDKLANPRINKAVRDAIELYISKVGCDVRQNNYCNKVFMQLSGTHKGKVISEDGYLKALKKAGNELGISYNIGTHSARKTFGMMNRRLHPNDFDSMEILQTIYNHSDTKTTNRYIGLTKQKVDKYYDEMGDFFGDYIVGDKEFIDEKGSPIISIDTNDFRDVIKFAYELGRDNHAETDALVHVDAINEVMGLTESLAK